MDYAHEANDRRSVSGEVVMCAGACVSLYYRTLKSITLSSTEGEYVAMVTGLHQMISMRYLWSFIFPDRDVECTLAKKYNPEAIHMAKYHVTTPIRKHVDVRHHFPRERLANGEFEVIHVWSALHHVDFLTRGLLSPRLCL